MIITLTISNIENNGNSLLEEQKSRRFSSDREYSIGRLHESGTNDWDLPDADNKISRHHATIFFKEGHFFIRDEKSVSGIWFCNSDVDNDEKQITSEQILTQGNILFIGFYEINVAIDDSPVPVVETQVDHVPTPSYPESPPAPAELPRFSEVIETQPLSQPSEEQVHQQAPTQQLPPEESRTQTRDQQQTSSVNKAPVPTVNNNFLAPFLEGLGIHLSTEELNNLSANDIKILGQSFGEAINGIIKLNRMRDKIKSEFDLDDTVFHSDNILKKANDASLALKTVMTTPKNYMPLNKSVTEIYQNIDELLFVMTNLLKIPAKKIKNALSPSEIERLTEQKNNKSKLFGKQSKWEVYCEHYHKLSVDEEIAISYKEELLKYEQKRRR